VTGAIGVLGLGNLVHRDDGVGVHAIQQLQRDERVPPGVMLLDGGTQGLSLIPHLSGLDRLIVIDAVDTGAAPGVVMRFANGALEGLPGKPSVHQLGFADLMVAMKLLGESPAEVVVFGVQPASVEWGAELTESAAKALDGLLDAVIGQLQSWAGEPATTQCPTEVGYEF